MGTFAPRVSVILPTFNRAGTILKSIESVLNQSEKNIELIIVDDASNDNTEEVVASVEDRRVRYFRLFVNKGAGNARNYGVSLARSEIIAFQDSDDVWLPNKLEIQLKHFDHAKNNKDLIVFSRFWRTEDATDYGLIVPSISLHPSGDHLADVGWPARLTERNYIGMPVVLLSRKLFERVGGFDPKLAALEDWELFIRLSFIGTFLFVPQVLAISYCTPGSVSGNRIQNWRALTFILERHEELFKTQRNSYAKWLHIAGYGAFKQGDAKNARAYFLKAVIWARFREKPKNLAATILSISPGSYFQIKKYTVNLYSRVIK